MKNKNIIVVRNLIKCLDVESLRNPEVVANLARAFGIVQWGPISFGDDEVFKNTTVEMAGIYQTPIQIAEMLVYLTEFKINSYLEIGIFQGGNFLFVSEYLRRFNPDIKCTGIDPTIGQYLNDEVKAIIESELFLSVEPITSDNIAGSEFDFVFIDGDHTYAWANKDWENIGKNAKICGLHDIQGPVCPDIVRFWNELKTKGKPTVEFLKSTTAEPTKGIGIIHNAPIIEKKNVHLVMPFMREENKETLLNAYRPMNIILHPILFEKEYPLFSGVIENWIQPILIPPEAEKGPEGMEVQNIKRNWFIENCEIINGDYYVAVDDDDMYEPNVFDELKKMDAGVVIISMKRGDSIPDVTPIRQYPTYTLYAEPNSVFVGGISNQQSFVKGSVFKKYLYDANGHCADGRIAVTRKENGEEIAYRPDLYALFNYYEPGRWDINSLREVNSDKN